MFKHCKSLNKFVSYCYKEKSIVFDGKKIEGETPFETPHHINIVDNLSDRSYVLSCYIYFLNLKLKIIFIFFYFFDLLIL